MQPVIGAGGAALHRGGADRTPGSRAGKYRRRYSARTDPKVASGELPPRRGIVEAIEPNFQAPGLQSVRTISFCLGYYDGKLLTKREPTARTAKDVGAIGCNEYFTGLAGNAYCIQEGSMSF
jgi:hypothetical protein